MEKIIEKLKEYKTFVAGGWFILQIHDSEACILKFVYPGYSNKPVFVFEHYQEFLNSNCLEILSIAEFIQIKDK